MRYLMLAALLLLPSAAIAQSPNAVEAVCTTAFELPLIDVEGVPAVHIKVDGKSVMALLDTGTSANTANKDVFRRLGGALTGETLTGVETKRTVVDMPRGRLHDVRIGHCHMATLGVALIPQSIRERSIDALYRADAILLGREFFDDFEWTFDFANRWVSAVPLEKSEREDRLYRAYVAALHFPDRSVNCLLDTGFTHPAQLFYYANSKAGSDSLAKATLVMRATHGGSASGYTQQFYIPDARIGDLAGAGIVANLEIPETGRESDAANYCLIGMRLLQKARVTLSPRVRNATITGELPVPEYNRAGIASADLQVNGDRARIFLEVIPGGSFELAGVRNGDELLSLNGQPVASLLTSNPKRLLYDQPGGTAIDLVISRDGQQLSFSVTIKDPFIEAEAERAATQPDAEPAP